MKFKVRRWDCRFNDPGFLGALMKPEHVERVNQVAMQMGNGKFVVPHLIGPDPRAADGKKTVIIHGKRVSDKSPTLRWPGAELWGVTRCNVLYWRETLPDWTRWFDLHPVHPEPHHRGILAKRPEAWDWYTRQRGGKPIYLLETHPDVPDSITFPRAEVEAYLQPYFDGYPTQFTVSVDWMIPFAMMLGFERIVLNGIGTRFEPDFQYEHQGIWHWIGFARGKGVELIIEGPSCYRMPQKVYGYEAAAPKWQEAMPIVTNKEMVNV